MSVYIIRSKDLSVDDCYVGSTKDFKRRMKEHKSRYNNNYNYNVYQFIRANGGWDNWEMAEICKCDIDKLKETEQYHIDFIKPSLNHCNANGINIDKYKLRNKINNDKKDKEFQKQRLNKYVNELVECDCGAIVTRNLRYYSRRTGRHNHKN